MAKAMTKLLSAPATEPITLVTTLKALEPSGNESASRSLCCSSSLAQGSCSARSRSRSTASGSESDSASACSAMLGATSQPRRPGPAAGPQRMRPSKPCRATGCACSASSSRRGSTRRTGWTRTAARESRRPARRRCTAAPQRPGRPPAPWRGWRPACCRPAMLAWSCLSPDEYKGYDRPRGALIQAFR